jgi:trehalose 6-phosphate phosphatase
MATPEAADAAMDKFAKLDPKAIALLLDVDGTLVDIAPSPSEVHVSDELVHSLQRLLAMTGGALALVSGRSLADLDRLFSPLELPAIGGHGAEMRIAPGVAISRVPDMPAALRQKLIAAATPSSGLQYEDKGYSVALHYRNAPREAERLRHHIGEVRAAFPDENTQLLLGKAMFEVKRPGINKGAAVKKLMSQPPFAGRMPVFLGDDVTDESVFALLPEMRGVGFSVGRHFDGLAGIFESPSDVRRALRQLAGRAQDASA